MPEAQFQPQGFDAMTALPGRLSFMRALHEAAALADGGALLFIDLDHFKRVNDERGLDAGDLVLSEVGETLRLSLPRGALLARVGGDEFAVLLAAPCDLRAAASIAESLRAAVAGHPFGNGDLQLTVSVGVAVPPREPGWAARDWFDLAGLRVTAAKKGEQPGRNRVWAEALPIHWDEMRIHFLGWPALG